MFVCIYFMTIPSMFSIHFIYFIAQSFPLIFQMAPTFIWIHLEKKAKSDRINLHRDVPNSLKKHHEYEMTLFFILPNECHFLVKV